MASNRKEIESNLSKGTSEAARLHVYIHHYMSLLYKRYLNQKQKIMNMGMKNVSKEMIQMLIALPLKSWSKPSTLIVILWQCNGATDLIGDFVVKSAMGRGVHAYQDKMGNPFDVEYVEGIAQQSIGSLNCGIFVATYIEYLSDGSQVPNDGLDARLHRKKYSTLLWIYGEAKAQKPYASNIKDLR
ncbi:hypothetical protein BC332_21087 [Capsicum chinense]|nr:hypothetical protein BC332_21087 [Capsicum chinense]